VLIAEARCWVLRNRARLLDVGLGVGSGFLWVTAQPVVVDWLVGLGGWGRLSPNRWCGCLVLGVLFPWGGVSAR